MTIYKEDYEAIIKQAENALHQIELSQMIQHCIIKHAEIMVRGAKSNPHLAYIKPKQEE